MAAYAGKVIVLTGASSGIGRALARALAPQRPRLILAARDPVRLEEAAKECRAYGAQALAVPAEALAAAQGMTDGQAEKSLDPWLHLATSGPPAPPSGRSGRSGRGRRSGRGGRAGRART